MTASPVVVHEAAGPLSRPFRLTTLGLVAVESMISFEYLAVNTAMPTVARELDGLAMYALAFGGAMAAGVLCTVISGMWADVTGPKKPLWTGLALFVTGLLIAGGAVSMPMLIAGRIVHGFGGGLILVALYVIVSRTYPPSLKPRVFAALAAAWVLPAIIGPSITGLIVDYLHWRWTFWSVALLVVPASLLLRRSAAHGDAHIPTGAGFKARTVVWAAVTALSTGALQISAQLDGFTAMALGGAAVAAVWVSLPRLLPAGTFRAAPGLPAVIALRGLSAAAFIAVDIFVPLLLTQQFGLTPVQTGLAVTVAAVSWPLGSWWQSRPSVRWTRTRLIRVGGAMVATGTFGVAALTAPGIPLALGIVGWVLVGLGTGLVYPALPAQAMDLSAPAEQGRNSAALQLSDVTFTAVTVTAAGATFTALLPHGGTLGFVACFAIALLPAATVTAVAHRIHPQPNR